MRVQFSAIVLAFFFTACSTGPAFETHSLVPPDTPGGRMCTIECQQAKDYCAEDCRLKNRACVGAVQVRAVEDYDQYTRQQIENHAPIEFHPRDFERTTHCDQENGECLKSCDAKHLSCYTDCGGTVVTQSSCQSFCF